MKPTIVVVSHEDVPPPLFAAASDGGGFRIFSDLEGTENLSQKFSPDYLRKSKTLPIFADDFADTRKKARQADIDGTGTEAWPQAKPSPEKDVY